MVAANKTVTGINGEFVETTDQSCLNRFLTEVAWDEQALNERRLELLQREPTTRYSNQGVIALDDTLIDHDGKFIKDVGWFWDHAEDRNKIAHDYLFVNYVCTSGKHYPLEFRRFKKREQCEATGETFQDHTVLFCQLVDWVCTREIPGDFTFDSYFTHADNLNHIHSKQDKQGRSRGYVGDLKFNRKVEWKGKVCRADELAASIPPEDRKELRRGDQRQWYFTCTLHIPKVNHKLRIVILWNHRRDTEPRKILVSNRTTWEVCRVLRPIGIVGQVRTLALQQSTFDSTGTGLLSFGTLAVTLGGLQGPNNLSLLNTSSVGIALSVGNNGSNTTFAGGLSGAGATLTKVGTGTLVLTGGNTYGGATTISAGTLQIGRRRRLGRHQQQLRHHRQCHAGLQPLRHLQLHGRHRRHGQSHPIGSRHAGARRRQYLWRAQR